MTHRLTLSVVLVIAIVTILLLLESRPDRKLTYEIEVLVEDGRTLLFKGATECSYSVNINDYRGRYSTKAPEALLEVQDSKWILSGIDCDNEIVEKTPSQYRLYKVIDDRQAKVFFVMSHGPARIVQATFDSTFIFSSNAPRNQHFTYIAGPYLYQKVFLKGAPPGVNGLSEPTVVFQDTNVCGKQNNAGISLSKDEFFEQFRRSAMMLAVEEGTLTYKHNADAWTTLPGANPSTPMDVAAFSAIDAAEKLEYGCVRLLVNNRTFVVSENALGSFLYVPAEEAFYRVARISYSDARAYLEEQVTWYPCQAPETPKNLMEGRFYIRDAGFQITKKIAGHNFLCRKGFRWLGSSGY